MGFNNSASPISTQESGKRLRWKRKCFFLDLLDISKISYKSIEPELKSNLPIFLQPKKRRNVAFKVQKYHSVYEYPKEVVEISPAISEPQLWQQTLEKFIEAQQREPPTPMTPPSKDLGEDDDLISQDIDGFMISSSSRPFQMGSQFMACNTWPGDGDFSWSQYQVLYFSFTLYYY